MLRAVIGNRTVSRSVVYEALREPSIIIDCANACESWVDVQSAVVSTRVA